MKRNLNIALYTVPPLQQARSPALKNRACFKKNCEIDIVLFTHFTLPFSHPSLPWGYPLKPVWSPQSLLVLYLSSPPNLFSGRIWETLSYKNHRLIVTPFGRFCFYQGILQNLRLFIIFLALKMQFICPMSNARGSWEPIQLWPISLGQVLAGIALQLVSFTRYYSASTYWHHNMEPATWFKSFLFLI